MNIDEIIAEIRNANEVYENSPDPMTGMERDALCGTHALALCDEVERLRAVCAALMVFMPDAVADIDVHEWASGLAETAGRDGEPSLRDYEDAIVQVVKQADKDLDAQVRP